MRSVDINCDLGEGMENDAELMPFISSANIACGSHAGDDDTMRRTVELCLQHGVAIGAHPSYPDRANFGRVDILHAWLKAEELPRLITEQVNHLKKICGEFGTGLHHVKPHGALYNRAAADEFVSSMICSAINEVGGSLILYGLSGSKMEVVAGQQEISFASEVFADRTYLEDGMLTPRTRTDALLDDPDQMMHQVIQMIKEGKVASITGKIIRIKADTICVHGDGPHALSFAQHIYHSLMKAGIEIRSIQT